LLLRVKSYKICRGLKFSKSKSHRKYINVIGLLIKQVQKFKHREILACISFRYSIEIVSLNDKIVDKLCKWAVETLLIAEGESVKLFMSFLTNSRMTLCIPCKLDFHGKVDGTFKVLETL
jgi:hypothetical protein